VSCVRENRMHGVDGRRLETERATVGTESGRPRETGRMKDRATYSQAPPRQSPTPNRPVLPDLRQ
jgi:hypothetical protein